MSTCIMAGPLNYTLKVACWLEILAWKDLIKVPIALNGRFLLTYKLPIFDAEKTEKTDADFQG